MAAKMAEARSFVVPNAGVMKYDANSKTSLSKLRNSEGFEGFRGQPWGLRKNVGVFSRCVRAFFIALLIGCAKLRG